MKMKPQQQAGGIGGRMVYPNTNNVRPTGSVGIVSRAAAAGNNSFLGSITAITPMQVPVWEQTGQSAAGTGTDSFRFELFRDSASEAGRE